MTCSRAYFFLFVIVGCTSPKVVSVYNDNLDFSRYETFLVHNPLDKDRNDDQGYAAYDKLEHAIENQMNIRGYLNSTIPDIYVSYRFILDPKIHYRSNNQDPYSSQSNQFPTRVRRTKFDEGILMIEITERARRKMVWQGSLDLKVNKKKKNIDIISESVAMIFENYVYEAGKKNPIKEIE